MLLALSTKGNQIRAARGWAGGNYGFKDEGANLVRIPSEAVVAIFATTELWSSLPSSNGLLA